MSEIRSSIANHPTFAFAVAALFREIRT